MKMRNSILAILIILITSYAFGEGIKVNFNYLKEQNVKIQNNFKGSSEVRMFTDLNGCHYLIGYYPQNRIKILPVSDSIYLSIVMQSKKVKVNAIKEARVPFVIYEFFSCESYASLLVATYSRYGINNISLSITTFPIMTAAGIIAPMIYTSNHEISYGELIHSFTSNIYMGSMGAATNYLITGKFEPLTTLLSGITGNVLGYWMAKAKRYSPGQALVYDEVLQKTSYISLTASTIYQDSTLNGRIVAGSFIGATGLGAVASYLLAGKYSDIKTGDIFILNGLSNSVSAVVTILTGSFVDNVRVMIPVSYVMFTPGYYLAHTVLKSGHIKAQDGILFNLGIYAGYLLGGAVDALLAVNTGYNKLIGTATGGFVSTFIMYNWVKNRTSHNVMDSKISFNLNPIPIVTYDKNRHYIFSFDRLVTIKF